MSDFSSNSMVRYLIGASRIKFSILEELFHGVYIGKNGVSMWVDAHSILYRLYRKQNLSFLESIDENLLIKDLVVNFINVLAHYRRFYATRFHAPNRIYVLFNTELPTYQAAIHSMYRKKLFQQYSKSNMDYGAITKCVNEAFKFIQSVLVYVDGIYLVDTRGIEDFTAMRFLMMQPEEEGRTHIIFSKDMLPTQLLDSNVYQLVGKRDNSYIISSKTCYQNGILKDRKRAVPENMLPEYLPFVWTVGGCSDIDLDKSKYASGVSNAVKLIGKMVEEKVVQPGMSIQSFLKALGERVEGGIELRANPTKTINRYRAVHLDSSVAALTTAQQIQICSSLIDLYDQNSLEELNDLLSDINSNGDLLDITNLNMEVRDDIDDFLY